MGRRLHLLMLGLCVLGFAGGFAAKRAGSGAGPDRAAADEADRSLGRQKSRDRAGGRGSERGRGTSVSPATPTLRSSDTLDDLLSVGDDALYPRLALRLLDASKEDIAAFWEAYSKRENKRREVIDLIFVGWTRLDPLGATAAVEGTEDEWIAWRSWACNDPEAALAACLAHKPEIVSSVAGGIGEFHPDWLLKNFDRIPEEQRESALGGLAGWGAGDDPEAMLDLFKELRLPIPQGLVRTLVQRDPWAAVDWFEANGGQMYPNYGTVEFHRGLMIETLAEYHPEVLEALAAREPAGARRRAMEEKLFARRLESDLEGAMEEARATRGPRVAVERLALVGARLAGSDPERAFGIARDLAALDYDPFNNSTWLRYLRGGSGGGNQSPEGLEQLLDGLLADDPERLLRVGAETRLDERTARSWESEIAGRWAAHNVEEYAGWVAEQPAGADRDKYSLPVAYQLRGQERFGEAMDWSMSLGDESSRRNSVGLTLQEWARSDPQAAAQWMEEADLSEAERQRFERYFPEPAEGGPGGGFRPIER